MLAQRLTLGPVLMLALLGVTWLDEWLTRQPTPRWLADRLHDLETYPPGTVIFLAAAVMILFAALELAAILRANNITASRWVTCCAALTGLVSWAAVPTAYSSVTGIAIVLTASVMVLLLSLVYYSRHHTVEGVVAAAGGAVFSFVYLGVMFSFLLAIRRTHSAWALLGVVLVTKSCDIGAFFSGTLLGRNKLIPWLSPGKTWEGLIGGLIFATAVGALLSWPARETGLSISWVEGAVLGVVFGLIGQGGDLIASLLKRDAGMKDASNRLPGFGGFLDVLDSPLLVAPAAFWLLRLFERA